MYRNLDLDSVKLHYQELYAEAERYRLIKNSMLFNRIDQTRWYMRLLDGIGAWITRWRCTIQAQFSQNLFPGVSRLAAVQNPCQCLPEPCSE